MKKALVLTMVLVFALASSAFAGVTVSGEFETVVENDAFEFLAGGFSATSSLSLELAAEGEDETNWSLEAELGDLMDSVALGEFKLEVTDDYFDLFVWGNEYEFESKADAIGLLEAGDTAGADATRVRAVVDPVENASFTVDLEAGEQIFGFADFVVGGYDLGVAANRDFDFVYEVDDSDPANPVEYSAALDTFVGYGTFDVDVATVKLAAGLSRVNDIDAATSYENNDNYGYGIDVSVPVNDEVTVSTGYTAKNVNFVGGDSKEFTAGAAYEVELMKASLDFTNEGTYDEFNKSTIEAVLGYRFGTGVAFGDDLDDLFDDFSNVADLDAPALEVSANQVSFKDVDESVLTLGGKIAAPVVEDLVWAKAGVSYGMSDEGYGRASAGEFSDDVVEDLEVFADKVLDLDAALYVAATEKLTLKPSVAYKSAKTSAYDGTLTELKGVAEYAVGSADLAFELSQKTYNDDFVDLADDAGVTVENEKLAKFSVTVGF